MCSRVTALTEPPARIDPLWADWDTLPVVPNSPALHLVGFDGPMDLLLDLAERQRIDLGRVSILALVEQFVAAMDRLQRHVPLERRAEWLVMATRLLLLRSRLLIATSPEAEAVAARDAGLDATRLDRLCVTRALAAWLEQRPQLDCDVFVRPSGRSPAVTSYLALMEACLIVLRGPNEGLDTPVYRPNPVPLFRLGDAVARIRALVRSRPGEVVAFTDCLPTVPRTDARRELKARSAVASSFVALLELTRTGEIIVDSTDLAWRSLNVSSV